MQGDAPERIITNKGGTMIINAPAIPLHPTDVEYVRADVSRTAVEAAYIAGLDAAEKVADDNYEPRLAISIRALKDPAHVRYAVAKLTEGRG